MIDKEPIWIKRMAGAFNEWALRYQENPDEFSDILDANGDVITNYGYRSAKYLCQLIGELDDQGKLPRATKEPESEWIPYTKLN